MTCSQALALSSIILDSDIQPRQQLNQEVVAEYAGAMKQGTTFPPVIVFFDGDSYWLADGFHRIAAKQANGDLEIIAERKFGSRREAILYAAGANATHGLRRTSADKRRAIERLLQDPEWCQWSDRQIARLCGTSPTTVGTTRQKLSVQNGQEDNSTIYCQLPSKRQVLRNGKTQYMDVTNIGSKTEKNRHISAPTKTIQQKNASSTAMHKNLNQQLVSSDKDKVRHRQDSRQFRIIDAEIIPPEASNKQLEVYSRLLIEGPVKAWSIIVDQMQVHPEFAEQVWRQAQDLYASAN